MALHKIDDFSLKFSIQIEYSIFKLKCQYSEFVAISAAWDQPLRRNTSWKLWVQVCGRVCLSSSTPWVLQSGLLEWPCSGRPIRESSSILSILLLCHPLGSLLEMQNPRFHPKLSEAEFTIYKKIYLSVFGHAGSSLLPAAFSRCGEWLAVLCCGAQASHCCGFSLCRAWGSRHMGFSSCSVWVQ